jgi:alpha-1,3-rhamnosyl/mannosyltransferase
VLRIGFDGRALASPAAGMRRYSRELFGAMAALPGVTVVAIGAPDGAVVPPAIEAAPAAASLPTNAGWMLTGLPRAANRARLDLFHAPSYTTPFGGPRPLVLTIHDVSYERHPEWYPYKRGPLRRAFYRRSALAADRIVTDSQFSRDEIAAAYAVSRDAIDVVPLAAGPAFSRAAAATAAVPGPYVLHVGDIHPRRNLPMVAQAIADIRGRSRALRDLALVLAGVDRDTVAALEAIAAGAPGGRPMLVAKGATPEAELIALYRGAAALVYPSRYEGFGLPLLEAMGCGTPVIAARSSSIPEVVGDAGVLLDPDDRSGWADAIERAIEDREWARSLADAGAARAALFSWERAARETLGVYRTLLGRAA